MKTGMLAQPRPHCLMLVRRIVVHDQVQLQFRGSLPLNLFQETQSFEVGVPGSGLRQNLAVQIRQSRKQGEGAVPNIVMRLGADLADSQGKTRLGPLQRLTLAFFIAAQY